MKRAPKTRARNPLPRAHQDRPLPYGLSKPGQGPGETPTPPGVRNMIKGLLKRVKP